MNDRCDAGRHAESVWAGLEEGRAMDLERVRADGRGRRARMLAAFEALGEVPAAAEEWFEESGTVHYAEHARDLVRWSDEVRSGA